MVRYDAGRKIYFWQFEQSGQVGSRRATCDIYQAGHPNLLPGSKRRCIIAQQEKTTLTELYLKQVLNKERRKEGRLSVWSLNPPSLRISTSLKSRYLTLSRPEGAECFFWRRFHNLPIKPLMGGGILPISQTYFSAVSKSKANIGKKFPVGTSPLQSII